MAFFEKKGADKSRFFDRRVFVSQPPIDQMTWNFACKDLLLLIFVEAKIKWLLQRPNLFWPPNVIGLYSGHLNLAWTKIECASQRALNTKFKVILSIVGAELQQPSCQKNWTLLFPFKKIAYCEILSIWVFLFLNQMFH